MQVTLRVLPCPAGQDDGTARIEQDSKWMSFRLQRDTWRMRALGNVYHATSEPRLLGWVWRFCVLGVVGMGLSCRDVDTSGQALEHSNLLRQGSEEFCGEAEWP